MRFTSPLKFSDSFLRKISPNKKIRKKQTPKTNSPKKQTNSPKKTLKKQTFTQKKPTIYDEIHNCILSILNVDVKIFDKLFTDYTKLFHKSKLNTPIQICKDQLTCGMYGKIYKVKDQHAIVKTYEKRKIDYIIQENMIHILLYCLQTRLKKCFSHPIPNCIPKIYKFVKKPQKMTMMEYLDTTTKFIFLNQNFKAEKDFLLALMYILYFLQQTTNFTHRDLHYDNVMLKNLDHLETTQIYIDGKKVTELYLNYRVYLIDFGFSCLSFKKCVIDLPDIVSGDFYKSKICTNKSHDPRLFLASIYFSRTSNISLQLYYYLKKLFTPYEKLENFNTFKYQHHFFYNNVIDIDDPNFYPQNIILNLMKL